ncbi:tripartite tricarboxylate transporter substrate binding protein [Pigmentiphaga sp. H8]|uniref:Bug family tripartite tricarboxylate transporter substrate binding protein n=1 Tax=unclassified Pigmentiphaga TaxID=2626614 RepID=UPI000F5B0579|nr:tripartite tricarboxylate transporter substrate binding protein [Pigmentiphaga sp. H8]AZG09846.1 tripartite tricarboxylate transporter substrate binding protein [Pigmentiphaga sp. H8]
MSHRRLSCVRIAAVACLAAVPMAVPAQSYPARPVRLIAPFPPGGSVDQLARLLSAKLAPQWKQSVVVENRPGAAGAIGVDLVAKAPPDGYTFVLSSPGAIAINQHFRKMPYDAARDLAPVTMIATIPTAIAVHPSVPVRNVADLIALGKGSRQGLLYSVSGSGSQTHLAGELLASITGAKMAAVPYKGTAPAALAIASGEVNFGISDLTTLLPLVQDRRLRILAVVDAQRPTSAPDVPTVAESGYPDYVASGWVAMFAPAGTPADIVRKVSQDVGRILNSPEGRQAVIQGGMEPAPGTPEALGAFVTAEIGKWGRVIRTAHIKVE